MSERRALEPPRFEGNEPAITILHVSDMQFGKHHRFADADGGFDTLLQRLCDDLDLLRRDYGLAPDLVALTGDLAEWGTKREFAQVAAFGEGLRAHLELAPDRLLVIPGNHDIDRKRCESYFLLCESDGVEPRRPYWPKWEPYVGLFHRLYRDVEHYRFTELEPWTLFEIRSLKVVVAGLNSTMRESHRDEDHHGFVGEDQLRWFADRLAEYEDKGWLRVGIVHHNAVRRAAVDDENLKDADDLREILGDRLHVLLHGHTHQGRVETLGTSLPVIATGSAAVKRDQRPGPSPDLPGEIPNQYQLVRLTHGGLWLAARAYTHERKRWIGDTRISRPGDRWWDSLERTWSQADATFPLPAAAENRRDRAEQIASDEDDGEPEAMPSDQGERGGDLLGDVIGWCRIRGEGRSEVTRVHHRGPWGHYAKVHDRDRGIGLLGAHQGELTAEVLDRWLADVHNPFRGRGQPVSKLVIATSAIDPALRWEAQARGVDVERMIDYQRVLDTVSYSEKLRERLAKDPEYPSKYYLEQRMTVWSPVHASSERIERAADWLSTRLLEQEGSFVLVLGPAGAGKTFLLREVCRRLGGQQAITPILVELRDLERARTIDQLAATQFTNSGVPWHPKAFLRDLEDSRLALLFDGFDELAQRVRSAAILPHFEEISKAAVMRARIVVSSRTEHFLSRGQVADLMTPSFAGTTGVGSLFERVPRRHVLEVHPFEREDVAVYLRRRLGDSAGRRRYARLESVHDLVGLACNPRMLSFLVDIPEDKLVQAAGLGDSITSDALYRNVIDEWLKRQAAQLNPPGAAPGPDAEALRDAATNLALQLWREPDGSIRTEDVGTHAGSLLARMCEDDPEWAAHTARTRTLLTRDDRGRIAFVHQTVLEWLVVGSLAGEIAGDIPGNHLDIGRLNVFMIDVLRERLGDDVLESWANARLSSPTTGAATENANDVLQRLGREARVRAIYPDRDLRGLAFGGQTLCRAIFDRSDLSGARLVGRDLTGASLVDAQLAYADFTDACLQDANLSGANLAFARFHRADLAGARLAGARLTGASFIGAKAVPALDDADAVGVALAASLPVEVMYARATSNGCRLAFNVDGTVLASGHGDGTVRLWDCLRGQIVRILPGHGSRVLGVTFSPDGKTLAIGAADGTVRLCSAGDGSERARLARPGGRVFCVAYSPSGKTVASADDDGVVRLWDVRDRSVRTRLAPHGGGVFCVAYSPSGKTVASGAEDGTVRLWNVSDERERARLVGHGGRVLCVAFSRDGKTLASGADDTTVRLWSAGDGSEGLMLSGHEGGVHCVTFSPDGDLVASGAEDGTVRLWNAMDGSERARLTGHSGGALSVVFASDGKTIASGAEDGTVRIWSVGDGRERARLVGNGRERPRLAGHGRSISCVAFSPSGKTVASASDDGVVRLWDAEDGSERVRLTGHLGRVLSVAFSKDGRTVASSGGDDTVRLWDAVDGAGRAWLAAHGGRVRSVAFSPSGTTVASGGDDATVRLWSAWDGKERDRLEGHRRRVFCVAFSPDGKLLVSGGADDTVRLWNVAGRDGRERVWQALHGGSVHCVAFSSDGKILASGGDDATVRLWRVGDGRERMQLSGHDARVLSVAFSPDDKLVASSAADGTVRLWNAADGRERLRLVDHNGSVFSVSSVAFSPDGKTVASGAADGAVRLWDVAIGRCLAILYGTSDGTAAVRPDGCYRVRGDVAGHFWHVIGLHRYDVGELDALVPGLRLADDEPLYPSETVVAEKLDALVKPDVAMKDVHDLFVLARRFEFDGELLVHAIRTTFERRKTQFPAEIPTGLTGAFAADPNNAMQWTAFVRKVGARDVLDLESTVAAIAAFALAPLHAATAGSPFQGRWPPGGPWT